jgi:hypothetical protein
MATIQDVRAIQNPQKSYMWEIDVQALSTGTLDDLSFYAKTVSIPQSAVDQIIINHKAGKAHHSGRDASSHTVTLTFFDTESLPITKFFQDWHDVLLHNQINGGGTTRDLYGADLVIRLKDSTDEVVTGEFKLSRVFPIDISEIPLSYDGSEPIELSITLSYDKKILTV